MAIHQSAEDYLESVLRLRMKQGTVRSVDVAADMNFSKPSVSVAMKKLRESGHIQMDDTGALTLTPMGEAVAQRIYERHRVLAQMLTALGVDPQTAAEEACRIEHVICDDTFEKIKTYMQEKSG